MSEYTQTLQTENPTEDDFKINLFELAISLGEEKIIIFITFIIITIGTIIYSLLITPTYVAKSTLLLTGPQTNTVQSSSLAMLGSGLSGLMGGFRSQEETYVAFLNSDSLLDAIIKKLNLQKDSKKLIDIRDELKGAVKVSIDKKSNLITIEAENSNPNFAAELVNTYVNELANLVGEISLNSSQQRLLFYQRAIAKTQAELLETKSKFREANEQSPVISTASMAESTFLQIQNKELQINAMSNFTTKQNPDIQRLEAELTALRKQLYKTDIDSSNLRKTDANETNAIDKYREIKSLEAILSTLTSQYKSAAMETYSANPSFIQQLDKAVAPERRTKPQRSKMVVMSAIFGLFLGILIGVLRIKLRKLLQNMEFNSNIIKLKNSWLKFN